MIRCLAAPEERVNGSGDPQGAAPPAVLHDVSKHLGECSLLVPFIPHRPASSLQQMVLSTSMERANAWQASQDLAWDRV